MDHTVLACDWSLDHLEPIEPTRHANLGADQLLALVERNDCDAMFVIGFRFEIGDDDTSCDLAKAMHWYERAATRASAEAAFNLARLALNGPEDLRDTHKAAKLFHYAAERGNLAAAFAMGVFFDAGIGIPSKPDEAVHWYRRAAKGGHAAAAVNLSRLFFSKSDSKIVHLEAVKLLRELEKKPSPKAWTNLAIAHEFGFGVAVDSAKAADLFLKAAEFQVPEAYYHLGRMHQHGRGVVLDEALAADWFNKAAELGCDVAAQQLGQLLVVEEPVVQPHEPPQIAHDIRKTPSSYTTVAQMPAPVEPVTPRPDAVLRRIKNRGARVANTIAELLLVAEAGVVDAQFNLGVLYRDGVDAKHSPHDAVYWFRQAGNQGDAEALWLLGSMYADGDGITKCEWEAEKVFRKAIELLTERGQDASLIETRLEMMMGPPVKPVTTKPKANANPVKLVEAAWDALLDHDRKLAIQHLREALEVLESTK